MACIEDLMGEAIALYDKHGREILKDKKIRSLLDKYQERIAFTNKMMQHADIVKTCAVCAAEQAGSCCMQDVEEWYDVILLLINLLMGTRFPSWRDLPGHCFFLGNQGCKLKARYPFCVNYLCPRLKNLLGAPQTQTLMQTSGEELFAGWEVEKSIHNWLNFNSGK